MHGFERFRLVLVKNHARMGWKNRYRGIYRCRGRCPISVGLF